jgi:hypothetical protein
MALFQASCYKVLGLSIILLIFLTYIQRDWNANIFGDKIIIIKDQVISPGMPGSEERNAN